MKEQSTGTGVESRNLWDQLEDFVRDHIQQFIQRLLVEEVTVRLGRAKSVRRAALDAPEGYRNEYGKLRKLVLTCGTITVQRPRVRGLAERFISRILLLFKRRTKQLGSCFPSCICTDWHSAISSWRCGGCWARGRHCRRPRSNGSKPSGRTSMRPGSDGGLMSWRSCTCGPMGCM